MPAPRELRTLTLLETALASLGLGLLWTRTHPAASRAADGRRAAARIHNRSEFSDRDRDAKFEHQRRADSLT